MLRHALARQHPSQLGYHPWFMFHTQKKTQKWRQLQGCSWLPSVGSSSFEPLGYCWGWLAKMVGLRLILRFACSFAFSKGFQVHYQIQKWMFVFFQSPYLGGPHSLTIISFHPQVCLTQVPRMPHLYWYSSPSAYLKKQEVLSKCHAPPEQPNPLE